MLALPFPVIDPVALEVGPLAIRWYSLAYVAGLVLGWRYMLALTGKPAHTVEKKDSDDFLLWATLGVILGGRLGYMFFYKPAFFLENISEIPAMWHGGMSFHGGALGMLAATILFCRKRGISLFTFGDLICAAVPIGLFFGRIANFINGELYGRATGVAWGMVFPRGGPEPRHPSQLYEGALEGALLFIVLAVMIYRFEALRRPGLVAGVFFAGYGLSRYLVEFVREPDAHLGVLFGFITMGQILSLPVILAGLWLVRRSLRQS